MRRASTRTRQSMIRKITIMLEKKFTFKTIKKLMTVKTFERKFLIKADSPILQIVQFFFVLLRLLASLMYLALVALGTP